ncbi:hypothetical protein EDD17DRAFT_1504398 [Pisolithus thermaeus]|nr:hypothetical protein EDD17DRAFT_1504398 [Pisolithus thermaeus]
MSQSSLLMPTPPATTVWDWLSPKPNTTRGSARRRHEKIKRWQRRLRPGRGQRLSAGRERWQSCIGRRKLSAGRERRMNAGRRRKTSTGKGRKTSAESGRHRHGRLVRLRAEGRSHVTQRAKVNCTYELAKATGTKKVQKHVVPAESASPRAGEKKKHAWAKTPEVEVVGGSSQAEKGKSVACDTSITGGLYTIAAMIDRHTKEMVQLQQTVKTLGSSHCHMIKSMAELLQEMTYPEPELPAESSSEESKEAEASDELG